MKEFLAMIAFLLIAETILIGGLVCDNLLPWLIAAILLVIAIEVFNRRFYGS